MAANPPTSHADDRCSHADCEAWIESFMVAASFVGIFGSISRMAPIIAGSIVRSTSAVRTTREK
jgi:hypothetical protein